MFCFVSFFLLGHIWSGVFLMGASGAGKMAFWGCRLAVEFFDCFLGLAHAVAAPRRKKFFVLGCFLFWDWRYHVFVGSLDLFFIFVGGFERPPEKGLLDIKSWDWVFPFGWEKADCWGLQETV